jgi:thioredoxin-related protein
MKIKLLSALAVAVLGTGSLIAGGDGWTQDFAAAKELAAKDKKDLLMDFTGSDWCGWCIKLDKEVFSQDAFKNVVPNDFVLVTIDFPQDESKITPEIKAQNEKLQNEYGIQGFPTIILADAKGRPYAQVGYEEGGAEKYVANLATLRKARVARDEAFAKAESAEGMEKAKLLAEGLAKIDPELQNTFYKEEVAAIVAADKDDTLGYGKKAKLAEQSKEFEAKVEEVKPQVMEALGKKDYAAAAKIVDDMIATAGYEGEMKQRALAMKIGFHAVQGDHDGAIKLVNDIIALDDKTETAGQLRDLLPRIEAARTAAEEQAAEGGAAPAGEAAEEAAEAEEEGTVPAAELTPAAEAAPAPAAEEKKAE